MTDTHEARELALALINENTSQFPYAARCSITRGEPSSSGLTVPCQWVALLENYAIWYRRQYDSAAPKPSDILTAAAEVADYYERHIAEIDG